MNLRLLAIEKRLGFFLGGLLGEFGQFWGSQLGPQNRSKKRLSTPRGPKSHQEALQKPPGAIFGSILETPGTIFGAFCEAFRSTCGKHESFTVGLPEPQETRETYRRNTRQTQQQRGHAVAPTAFSDSAFRFLSRQVLGLAGAVLGSIFYLKFDAFSKGAKTFKKPSKRYRSMLSGRF